MALHWNKSIDGGGDINYDGEGDGDDDGEDGDDGDGGEDGEDGDDESVRGSIEWAA